MVALFLQRFWRRWVLGLLALVSAIGLNGCDPSDFRTQATQVPQVVMSTLSDFKTFNYALNQEFPFVNLFTSEGLIGADEKGNIVPAQAESWQFSADNKRIVFTLREGLKWSDGQPLTAEDVVFTYRDVYLNEAIPTDMRDVLQIGQSGKLPSVRKIDDRRVEFSIPEPFAPFLRSTGAPLFPAHKLKETVFTKDPEGKPRFLTAWGGDANPQDLVWNGPYVLESYATSQRYVFRRNPHYWQKDSQGRPQPYIDRLVLQVIENTDTQLLRFRSADLDFLGETSTLRAEDFSLLKREEKRGNFTIQQGGQRPGTSFVSFNLNKGSRDGKPLIDPIKSRWFNSKEFRQAVAYALNRQRMVDNTLRGLGQIQDSPISVQSPFHLSRQEGLKSYDYNPQKAKELLQSAGFKYDNQGQLLDADGNRVRFTLITNAENRTRVSLGAQVKQDLATIGMQVDFNPIAFGTLVDKLSNTLDWECYLLGFTGGVEPNSGFNIWNPEGGLHAFNQKPQVGSPPIEGWQVADWEREIGNLYIQAAQELDETKRKALYARTQQITQEYLPMIHLINPMAMAAVRNRVQNVKYTALGLVLWNLPEHEVVER